MQDLSKDKCLHFMTEMLHMMKSTDTHKECFSRPSFSFPVNAV